MSDDALLVPAANAPAVISNVVVQNNSEDIASTLFRRRMLLNAGLDDVNTSPLSRDYWAQFGYPEYIDKWDYQRMYDRNPVANRVVQLYPLECWQQLPAIYDSDAPTTSDFEIKINQIFTSVSMWGMLRRIDVLSGIGNYGLLLLGVGDGRLLNEPVAVQTGKELPLLYVRAFPHTQVEIIQTEMRKDNPRYGLPTMYRIQFQQYDQHQIEGGVTDLAMQDVHWTRVVHVADNREVSEIYGVPRLQRCYNALLDLEKIFGSSGEMFYKGAYPGFVVEATDNLLGTVQLDSDSIRSEVEKYENNMQRWMALKNAHVNPLSSSYGDPTASVEGCINQVAIANGVPVRILLGSERGELASSQDAVIWKKRLRERQIGYLTPFLIRPVILRLIHYGTVPKPYDNDFHVEWPDLSADTQAEIYESRGKQLEFMEKYYNSNLSKFMSPVDFLVKFCDMSEKEADTILKNADTYANEQIDKEAASLISGGEEGGEDDMGGFTMP